MELIDKKAFTLVLEAFAIVDAILCTKTVSSVEKSAHDNAKVKLLVAYELLK